MISDPRMPIGMSLEGFLDSAPAVETASNPMYAKKIVAAAVMMPGTPYCPVFCAVTTAQSALPISLQMLALSPSGGGGCCAGTNGVHRSGFTKNAPMTMKATTTDTLIATTILLTNADSDTPSTS